MPISTAEREALIRRYAEGPAKLRAAFDKVPAEARQWRPAAGKWSAHEVVVHCADSETNASLRIRYLAAEKDPLIVGYDQEHWARTFDYHQHPADAAMATVEAVRANTVPLLKRLPESAWTREGKHTESGRYTGEDWLNIYAAHVENHARQIDRNLEAWKGQRG
jgi:hypothetical protein